MSLLVVGIGVALLTVPALCVTGALGPKASVRVACAAATAGIWLLGIGVLLTASPLLVWWHDQGEASGVDLGHVSPGGPWAWMASGMVGGVGASWLIGFLRHSARARRRAALPAWAATAVLHDDHAGGDAGLAAGHCGDVPTHRVERLGGRGGLDARSGDQHRGEREAEGGDGGDSRVGTRHVQLR